MESETISVHWSSQQSIRASWNSFCWRSWASSSSCLKRGDTRWEWSRTSRTRSRTWTSATPFSPSDSTTTSSSPLPPPPPPLPPLGSANDWVITSKARKANTNLQYCIFLSSHSGWTNKQPNARATTLYCDKLVKFPFIKQLKYVIVHALKQSGK